MIQAYRLYTLALAGSPEIGAMNRLKELKDLSLQAQWRLAAAYALAGKTDVANQMVASLPDRVPVYREWGYTYGSDLRDKAMILETLTTLDKTSQAATVAKDLATDMNSNRWMSTQETAYSLMAMAKYQAMSKSDKGLTAAVNFNGKDMYEGKKSTAYSVFYEAVDIIEQKMKDSEKSPLEIWKKSLENITPQVEVKSRRVGGATFQVPMEVRADRKVSISIKNMLASQLNTYEIMNAGNLVISEGSISVINKLFGL